MDEKSLHINILHTVPIDEEHLIVHTDFSVTLYHLPTRVKLWTIICPSFNFALDCQKSLLILSPKPPASTLIVWDLSTGDILHRLTYTDADFDFISSNGLAISVDGHLIAAGLESDDSTLIGLWDINDGNLLGMLKTEEYYDFIMLAFHPSGKILAAASVNGSYVWMWSLPDGQLVQKWEAAKQDRVYDIAFNLDGTALFAGCGNSGLHVWDMTYGHEIPGLDKAINPSFITIIPHQPWLAVTHHTGTNRTILLIEIGTWQIIHEFAGGKPSESCNPDGEFLATSENHGPIYLWQLATRKLLYSL